MKYLLLLIAAAWLLNGCAAYKQLEPKPPVVSTEGGFLPVRDDDQLFELKKEDKYYIAFPAPEENNFYLVVKMPGKKGLVSFLTDSLADESSYGKKIADEYADSAQTSVYAIHGARSSFYLLMEKLQDNVLLQMEYRYVPQWRFKFENKYAYYREFIKQNSVDRVYYKEVGSKNHFEAFNFPLAIDTVSKRLEALNGIDREFLALESIFPKRILNSSDNDYQNYVILRKVLEDEIRFQKDYLIALKYFNREYQCRGNTAEFVRAVDDFLAFFKEKDHLAGNVVQEAQSVLRSRLNEVAPFYDQRLSGKEDAKPFEPELYFIDPFLRLPSLYEASGLPVPAETQGLFQFVKDFDSKSKTLSALKDSLENIRKAVKACPDMPPNGFFGGIQARLSEMEKNIPVQLGGAYGKYSSFKCALAMNSEIIQFGAGVVKLASDCRAAEDLVVSLNAMKAQRDYPGMLALLLKNANLAFLLEKYKPLDRLSVDEQGNAIRGALSSQAWGTAEAGLFRLHQDKSFLNPAAIKAHKEKTVEGLEDSLYSKIDLATRSRVGKFLEEKVHTLENVDSLYTDSVFLPVYDVKFYSGTKGELLKRKTDLIDHLAKMKENEFPARAVKLLYDEFTRAPHDSGVYKAKAIVAHGAHYKGDDKDIKVRLSECDPLTPKWIVKPKEYRRLFGLPITDNVKGRNKYLVRINVDIPTDAQFPVYDVNIKLPKDLSGNAAEKQWYDQITLNKKELKNEGRFTISSPTAANEYECQITPVQMSKDKRNILEIAFSWPSYRVFVLSLMVQKPIIKKN